MKLFGRRYRGFAQWLVLCTSVLLVSSGLCGVQVVVLTVTPSDGLQSLFMLTGIAELAAMFFSIVGILVVAVAWPIAKLARRRSPQHEDEDAIPSREEE